MFEEMGQVPPEAFETLRAKSSERICDFLKRGEYIGWLAIPTEHPDIIAGGAGVQLREVLPHSLTRANEGTKIAEGRHAISSMYSPSPNGVIRVSPCSFSNRLSSGPQAERLDRLVLHASVLSAPARCASPTNKLDCFHDLSARPTRTPRPPLLERRQ